jgi:hypothetical protein
MELPYLCDRRVCFIFEITERILDEFVKQMCTECCQTDLITFRISTVQPVLCETRVDLF